MRTKVTLADIAKECGVGTPTVSRVLNNVTNGFSVKPEIRSKIVSTARRLSYSPNVAAKNLRRQRTDLIIIYGYDFEWTALQGVYPSMLNAATTRLQRRGFDVNAAFASENRRYRIPQMMDGALLLTNIYPELTTELRDKKIPYVILNDNAEEYESCVDANDVQGTTIALDYLYRLGHRRIGYWGDNEKLVHNSHKSISLRYNTYVDFMAASGQKPFSWNVAEKCPETIIRQIINNKVTAVLTYDIALAVRLISTARINGIKVPEDLSVIGFNKPRELIVPTDDIPTCVSIPENDMGQAAADILMKQISKPSYHEQKIIDLVLYEGSSTGKVNI